MTYSVRTSLAVLHCPRFDAVDTLDFKHPTDLESGGPIAPPRDLPTKAKQVSDHKYIPDILKIFGRWVVSEEFRQVVETLEPGVHQYFPLKLFLKNGEPVPKKYYYLNICQRADVIDMERSDTLWTTSILTKKPVQYLAGGGKIVVRKDRIKGLHLWRGTEPGRKIVFFSDELMNAVLEAKLPAIEGTPLEEV